MLLAIYTPETDISNEVETLSELAELGADWIIVRKPGKDTIWMESYLEQFSQNVLSKAIVSDWGLFQSFETGGFHFTRAYLAQLKEKEISEKLVTVRKQNKISSVSAHSIEELRHWNGKTDIIFVAPIFQSISKKEHSCKWDFAELSNYLQSSIVHRPSSIIALGGITDKNISTIKTLGFDGAALLGYLWMSNKNPLENFKNIQHAF